MKKLWLLVAAVLFVPGCSAISASVLEIGAIYPTGGGQGPGGVEEFRGAELATKLANSRGGVNGHEVKLVLEKADSADDAPRAVERLHRKGIDIVLGSYGSTISIPAGRAASDNNMIFWETGAVGETMGDTTSDPHVFRFPATGEILGRSAVRFVSEQFVTKLGSVAPGGPALRYTVVYVDDAYGRSVGLGAKQQVLDSHLTLAGVIPYALASANFTDIAHQIAALKTDILVVAAYLDDGVALRRATVEAGVHLVGSIGTSSSYCMPAFGAQLHEKAVGLFASDKPDGDVMDDAALSRQASAVLSWARTEYRARFHTAMSAPALTGFSGTWALLHHVLTRSTNFEAGTVSKVARSVKLPLGTLPNGSGLEFQAGAGGLNNHLAASVIWEWVKDGERQVVWPPEFATTQMRVLPIG